jgi:hypothetical protein
VVSVEDYFSDWKERIWICAGCGWTGTGDQAAEELFNELFEVNCPACNARLATVLFPTTDSIRDAADQGNPEAVDMMDFVHRAEQFATDLKTRRQQLKHLGTIDGNRLEFSLTTIDTHDWMNPSHIVLWCNGARIYQEPSGFEHWEAVIAIGQALLEQCGSRVAWYDPGEAGIALLGDRLSAGPTVQRFLDMNRITPPHGPWAHKERRHT